MTARPRPPAPSPEPTAAHEAAPAAQPPPESAYVLVRGSEGGNLARLFARLFVADAVCCCDPVLGAWDVVLLVQSAGHGGIERLAREQLEAPDVEAFEIHDTQPPPLPPEVEALLRTRERERLLEAAPGRGAARLPSAYALLDVAPEYLPSVYAQLCFDDDVVSCHAAGSFESALALVQARTEDALTRATSRIEALPGVLRARTLRIIHVPEGA